MLRGFADPAMHSAALKVRACCSREVSRVLVFVEVPVVADHFGVELRSRATVFVAPVHTQSHTQMHTCTHTHTHTHTHSLSLSRTHCGCAGCIGEGPGNCRSCANVELDGTCVAECPSNMTTSFGNVCVPCHPLCSPTDGCEGTAAIHCNSCRHAANVLSVSPSIVECVDSCDTLEFLDDSSGVCTPCHSECQLGCNVSASLKLASTTSSHTYTCAPSLTHSLTHTLTHTHSLTHSLTHTLTHSFAHTLTPSLTHSHTPSLTHSHTPSLTHSAWP